MSKMMIEISIKFREAEESVTGSANTVRNDEGLFSIILDGQSKFDIDGLENALLRTCYPAMRDALSKHLEQASKNKAYEQVSLTGVGHVEKHASLYKVDGELGRFVFSTYDITSDEKEFRVNGFDMFPARQGREWHQTGGYKEMALLLGGARSSYRQTDQFLNRWRRQEIGGTPLNTLRDGAEAEGTKVLDFLDRQSQKILKDHDFDSQGAPQQDCALIEKIPAPVYLEEKVLQPALTAVLEDMKKKGFDAEDMEKVKKFVEASDVVETDVPDKDDEKKAANLRENYEKVDQCVYISLDDVGVKKQKEHRSKEDSTEEPTAIQTDEKKGKRPMVQNTVARIEHNGSGFTLTGRNLAKVLVYVLGFLLNNELFSNHIIICIDGQRNLQGAILTFFSWHPHYSLLIDWYHVVKKFKEDLSTACKGREIRNRHLKQLLTLLWFGLNEEARAYLAAIPSNEIKNNDAIKRLINYLERNQKWMPCYAMRSKLNLPNSSNPVERSNNLVTAKRQKHHGMSWSKDGSHALTALNALTSNNAAQQWLKNRSFDLTWAAKAEKKAA